jgi:uncharacterized peroxidase-related enzyme
MSRITIPTVETSAIAAKPFLAAVQAQLGMVPNLMKLIGHSPAALEGYLALSGALGKGKLNVPLREQIALAVAEHNGCDYCLSAHSYLGEHVARLSGAQISMARLGESANPGTQAALTFAGKVLESKGHVSDADLAALHAAGFGDAEAVEIVVNVALNVLTNYVNNMAQTEVDFPKVTARQFETPKSLASVL